MPRYDAKADANQPDIVKCLRAVGATVFHTHTVGRGFPDLVVGFRKRNYLLEVKTEDGKLTDDEEKFHTEWNGTVHVVRNVHEALDAIGAIDYHVREYTGEGVA